ncbi:MAG: hypothetical protein Aurels2KO_33260 [Aureliella sp.]
MLYDRATGTRQRLLSSIRLYRNERDGHPSLAFHHTAQPVPRDLQPPPNPNNRCYERQPPPDR